jgi:hypothetical protein
MCSSSVGVRWLYPTCTSELTDSTTSFVIYIQYGTE